MDCSSCSHKLQWEIGIKPEFKRPTPHLQDDSPIAAYIHLTSAPVLVFRQSPERHGYVADRAHVTLILWGEVKGLFLLFFPLLNPFFKQLGFWKSVMHIFNMQVYSRSAKLKAQSAYINSVPKQSALVYTEIRIALNYTCNQGISHSKLWSFWQLYSELNFRPKYIWYSEIQWGNLTFKRGGCSIN